MADVVALVGTTRLPRQIWHVRHAILGGRQPAGSLKQLQQTRRIVLEEAGFEAIASPQREGDCPSRLTSRYTCSTTVAGERLATVSALSSPQAGLRAMRSSPRAELLGIQPAAQARLPISGSRLGRRR
ncbi:MAG TPA: hypothetical protein VGJ60_12280 [Chloroflexota bacterium]